jgi:hypothetical protein
MQYPFWHVIYVVYYDLRKLPSRKDIVSQIHCGDYYSLIIHSIIDLIFHAMDLTSIYARWLYGCSRTRGVLLGLWTRCHHMIPLCIPSLLCNPRASMA